MFRLQLNECDTQHYRAEWRRRLVVVVVEVVVVVLQYSCTSRGYDEADEKILMDLVAL